MDTFRARAVITEPDIVECEGRVVGVVVLGARGWSNNKRSGVAGDLDRGKCWVLVWRGKG